MTARRTFTQAEFDAIERAAKRGVRLALVARPDGAKLLMPAADADMPCVANDLDARLDAFGAM